MNNMSTSQRHSTNKPARVRNLTVNTDVPKVKSPQSSKSRTPFCGVCFKAKQPATIYNSHWTRMNPNPRSPITCPLILQTICNYCKDKGHSAKYCPVAAKKERAHKRKHRASSISSNVSSQSGSVSISSSPAFEKGSWLQAAMKSERKHNTEESIPIDDTKVSLKQPSLDEIIPDGIPSPPKLQRSRATWNWNDDVDSDDE